MAKDRDVQEQRRMEILRSYQLLDSPPEPAFDDIVQMASIMCDTPIALISLIDNDRQWFKARVGLEPQETPRDQAFCAHAILHPTQIMEVQDASKDDRFSGNPLVTGEPRIRFYAGAPLLSPSGVALGTVCVIDRVPRRLTASMAAGLRALSRQASELLTLRRANSDLVALNQSVLEMQIELEHYQIKLEEENDALVQDSLKEHLTGLINRRGFDQMLASELSRAARTQEPMVLIMADIDHFKAFNDDFGHVAGDAALRRVAQALKGQARDYDLVARYGGEEFAAILPATRLAEAQVVAERFRAAVMESEPTGRQITMSIGVAASTPTDTPLDIIGRADRALFHAKDRGRNMVVVAKSPPSQ